MSLRRASAGLAVALLLTACTSVDLPPRSIPDSREASGSAAASSRPARPSGTGSNAEDEQRRRAGIRLELAAGHYQQANYAQALEELRQAIAIDPGYAQAYGLRGLIQMALGERTQAEESFRQALSRAPDDSELLNNYGWFLCQTERPRESIPQFMAALKNPLYPTPARPLHNAGICSRRLGDEAAAEGYFLRSFQVDPSNPVAMYNLAEIYLKRSEAARARFYSQRLVSAYPPSAETLWLAIRIDRAVGERESVAGLSAQLRRQFPNSREAVLLQQGAFGD